REVRLDKAKHANAIRLVQSVERARLRTMDRVAGQLEQEKKRISQYWVEIHKKFSIPVACLVFVLVGAPLGIMARRGGIGTGVVYSLLFYVVYWVGLIGGENLADRLIIRPEVAMWAPNLAMGFAGIMITWRMSRDNYTGNSLWTRLRLRLRLKRKQKGRP
ncbi:MAG TPA: LptF/LptG family permease, partial [Fibrobacteraceae bacterium]|nr:LptF/LptG family permease [Fibrobacteraceae bacterium]